MKINAPLEPFHAHVNFRNAIKGKGKWWESFFKRECYLVRISFRTFLYEWCCNAFVQHFWFDFYLLTSQISIILLILQLFVWFRLNYSYVSSRMNSKTQRNAHEICWSVVFSLILRATLFFLRHCKTFKSFSQILNFDCFHKGRIWFLIELAIIMNKIKLKFKRTYRVYKYKPPAFYLFYSNYWEKVNCIRRCLKH